MTRIVNGFWDDISEDNGFFFPDNEVDLICEWLEAYADALEKSWVKKGSEGDPRKQKFTKVRSLKLAVLKKRGNYAEEVEAGNQKGEKS